MSDYLTGLSITLYTPVSPGANFLKSNTAKVSNFCRFTQELLKARVFQVAPAELGSVLLEHPEIAEAVVVDVSDEKSDSELPRAYIVLQQNTAVTSTAADIQKLIADRLASYKRLTGGVKFLEAIPRNTIGKPLRALLIRQAVLEMQGRSKL